VAYRKLGRDSSARKALFRSILTSFFAYERIETTEAKAKEISGLAEKMITLAKRGDLHARRQVLSYLMDEDVVRKHRTEVCGTPGRIHPHHETWSSSRRCCTDGNSRIGIRKRLGIAKSLRTRA